MQGLYASKIISYAQGFMLMREAAKVYDWTLNNAGIAAMWRGGCIIKVGHRARSARKPAGAAQSESMAWMILWC